MEFTGERYVPTEAGEIRHEHLHRYAWCARLVEGKDVLDIACGEGYGSAMLARRARSVKGVDIADDAVAHASAAYRDISNLAFMQGDAAQIPLDDNSVDAVVSFETIEHHDRHREMLSEIRRVLRMSSSGFASSTMKLARLPTASVPMSLSPNNSAGRCVAAVIACDGVSPSCTHRANSTCSPEPNVWPG